MLSVTHAKKERSKDRNEPHPFLSYLNLTSTLPPFCLTSTPFLLTSTLPDSPPLLPQSCLIPLTSYLNLTGLSSSPTSILPHPPHFLPQPYRTLLLSYLNLASSPSLLTSTLPDSPPLLPQSCLIPLASYLSLTGLSSSPTSILPHPPRFLPQPYRTLLLSYLNLASSPSLLTSALPDSPPLLPQSCLNPPPPPALLTSTLPSRLLSESCWPAALSQHSALYEDYEGKGRAASAVFVCLFVGCLTSQQHASVSQGRICSDNCTCCHTEIEVEDPTFYLTQS